MPVAVGDVDEAFSCIWVLLALSSDGEHIIGWWYHPNKAALTDKHIELKKGGMRSDIRRYRMVPDDGHLKCEACKLPC